MRPLAPRTGAQEITIAEEQEQYMPLTIAVYQYADGSRGLLSRYTLTDEERVAVANGEDIYVMQMNFGGGFTPQIVRCGPGDFVVADPEVPSHG